MKKRIALIGSDTIIGKSLKFKNLITFNYLQHELDWDKPGKVIQKIRKGFPDAYVIGYSSLDNCTSLLRTIIRTVIKALINKQTKVIGFVSSNIYGLQTTSLLDERLEPHPISNEGEYEYLAEQVLLKHPNSASLRFARFWSQTDGYILQLIRRMLYDCLETSENEKVCLTSSFSLSRAVEILIERDIGHIYNIVDKDIPTTKQLGEFLQKHIAGTTKNSDKVSENILDGRLWEAVSMEENDTWCFLLNKQIREILNAIK